MIDVVICYDVLVGGFGCLWVIFGECRGERGCGCIVVRVWLSFWWCVYVGIFWGIDWGFGNILWWDVGDLFVIWWFGCFVWIVWMVGVIIWYGWELLVVLDIFVWFDLWCKFFVGFVWFDREYLFWSDLCSSLVFVVWIWEFGDWVVWIGGLFMCCGGWMICDWDIIYDLKFLVGVIFGCDCLGRYWEGLGWCGDCWLI